jgi:CBS domain-containing protein
MIITKDISPYIVSCDDSIQFSLQKINKNRRRLVFVVSENGEATGALTDGDFRRWVVGASNLDLLRPVGEISNKNITLAKFQDTRAKLQASLSPKISAIPLTDELNRIIAIAWCEDGLLRLGSRTIGHNNPALLIAEIGNNHNGSLDFAKRLIEAAAKAGADCAKFQLRDMESLYKNSKETVSEDLGSEYTLDLLSRFQLSVDEMFEALNYVRQCGIIPLCTPWDLQSLNRLNE